MSEIERLALQLGLLYGMALFAGMIFCIGILSKRPTIRVFRWVSYLTYVVIAAVATTLLWVPPPDALALSAFEEWDRRGVVVLFGLALIGIGYVMEDVGEEFLTWRGLEPAPKRFRPARWLLRGGTST